MSPEATYSSATPVIKDNTIPVESLTVKVDIEQDASTAREPASAITDSESVTLSSLQPTTPSITTPDTSEEPITNISTTDWPLTKTTEKPFTIPNIRTENATVFASETNSFQPTSLPEVSEANYGPVVKDNTTPAESLTVTSNVVNENVTDTTINSKLANRTEMSTATAAYEDYITTLTTLLEVHTNASPVIKDTTPFESATTSVEQDVNTLVDSSIAESNENTFTVFENVPFTTSAVTVSTLSDVANNHVEETTTTNSPESGQTEATSTTTFYNTLDYDLH